MYKFQKVKFELRMRKKKTFQYRYYILALENITFSCLGSSSCVSTNWIAANYVLFIFSRITQDLYGMGLWSNHFYHLQECFKTYGVHVHFSDVASAVDVLTIRSYIQTYKYQYNNILHIRGMLKNNVDFCCRVKTD